MNEAQLTWHPEPTVWLLIGSLVGGYVLALRVLGPRLAGGGRIARPRHIGCFAAGVVLLELAADYPLHDLAENFLFSAHMVQHTLLSLVVPPLLLLGLPAWLLRWLVSPPAVHAVVSRLARWLPATLLFNAFIALSHWPVFVNTTLEQHWFHFVAHAVLFTLSTLMWLPAVNTEVEELPRYSYPMRMLHLFLQSIIPTVPSAFLAFAEKPMYRFYAEAPRLSWLNMNPVDDQQLAGGIMKIGGTTILWGVIIVLFFRWYAAQQRHGRDVLTWDDVSREFDRSPAPKEPPVSVR